MLPFPFLMPSPFDLGVSAYELAATALAWCSRWISFFNSLAVSSVIVDNFARRPDGRDMTNASYLKNKAEGSRLYSRSIDRPSTCQPNQLDKIDLQKHNLHSDITSG